MQQGTTCLLPFSSVLVPCDANPARICRVPLRTLSTHPLPPALDVQLAALRSMNSFLMDEEEKILAKQARSPSAPRLPPPSSPPLAPCSPSRGRLRSLSAPKNGSCMPGALLIGDAVCALPVGVLRLSSSFALPTPSSA